ncbi:MAG TPA: DUF3592 domain-containing protein [Anaerolineales bacterium]|nr:DUF3592 domain-containing protein [Anaerolineales bacterium]
MRGLDSADLLFLCLTFGTLAFCAIIANIYLFRMLMRAKRSEEAAQGWSATQGLVLRSEVKVRQSLNDDSTFPYVRYSYEVAGKTYHSDQIIPGGEISDLTTYKVVQRYPAGAQVTVYYDPHDPRKAVLERSSKFSNNTWLFIIVANIMLCILFPLIFSWDLLK